MLGDWLLYKLNYYQHDQNDAKIKIKLFYEDRALKLIFSATMATVTVSYTTHNRRESAYDVWWVTLLSSAATARFGTGYCIIHSLIISMKMT